MLCVRTHVTATASASNHGALGVRTDALFGTRIATVIGQSLQHGTSGMWSTYSTCMLYSIRARATNVDGAQGAGLDSVRLAPRHQGLLVSHGDCLQPPRGDNV